jgi:hypothetical protein
VTRREGYGWFVALAGAVLFILNYREAFWVQLIAVWCWLAGTLLIVLALRERERIARAATEHLRTSLKRATRTPVIRNGVPGWNYSLGDSWMFEALLEGEVEQWRRARMRTFTTINANAVTPEGTTAPAAPTKDAAS